MEPKYSKKKSLHETLADDMDRHVLFQVVVEKVVGSVVEGGTDSPRVVAFQLIAEQNEDGVYRFPNENGGTVTVAVETETP